MAQRRVAATAAPGESQVQVGGCLTAGVCVRQAAEGWQGKWEGVVGGDEEVGQVWEVLPAMHHQWWCEAKGGN
jgi:hypothetical protein